MKGEGKGRLSRLMKLPDKSDKGDHSSLTDKLKICDLEQLRVLKS